MTGVHDLVAVDIVGKLSKSSEGFSFVCTVMDVFSRYLVAYKIRNSRTNSVIKCMEAYFLYLGLPKALLCDNCLFFVTHKFSNAMTRRGVKVYHVTQYNSQSNPVERIHRELNRLWRMYCRDSHTIWSKYLTDFVQKLNYTILYALQLALIQVHLNEKFPYSKRYSLK